VKTISTFCTILTWRTAVVVGLSLLATYLCRRKGITSDLPTTLIGIAVVFPIVFSINAAYRRREDALKSLASIKANIVALAFAARDWTPKTSGKTDSKARALPPDLFRSITRALTDSTQENFNSVYQVFSQWSRHHEVLRQEGVSGSEISRANQYLAITMMEFKKMRNISRYRTPITLRTYSKVFLHTCPSPLPHTGRI
jgi:hypothetical protein